MFLGPSKIVEFVEYLFSFWLEFWNEYAIQCIRIFIANDKYPDSLYLALLINNTDNFTGQGTNLSFL